MADKKGKHSKTDESALFRDVIGEVTPVTTKRLHHEKKPGSGKARSRRADEMTAQKEPLEELQMTPVESAERLLFQRPQVTKTMIRKLRRGQYSIGDEIDLHGMTAKQAHSELAIFFHECARAQPECIRIVHGKGLRSGAAGPVLKTLVNSWLRIRPEVLAFCSASERDGGAGAVYVLLKKTKNN